MLVAIGSCFGAPALFRDMFGGGFTQIPIRENVLENNIINNHITRDDVVMFGGGEDISPSLYGAKKANQTWASEKPSVRDLIEKKAFEVAQAKGAKCYGICRGAQILCALSGGKLVQHVSGHGSSHLIKTKGGHIIMSSSVHHQMMWPFGHIPEDKFELIGWTEEKRSQIYVFDNENIKKTVEVEPEIIYFKHTKSLCVQGHPEFMDENCAFVRYNRELLKKYFIEEKSE